MSEIRDVETSNGNDKITLARVKLDEVISNIHNKKNKKNISNPKIQKVPTMLTRVDKYYEPKWVSIGPIHHGKSKLRLAEDRYKLEFVGKYVLERCPDSNYQSLYQNIKDVLEDLKKCFDHDAINNSFNESNDEKLSWIFFVDGCFVLQFIHSYVRGELTNVFKIKKDQMALIRHDIFLMENQIPFKVIEVLIDGSEKSEELKKSIKEFIWMNMLTPNRNQKIPNFEKDWAQDKLQVAHLLDLLRMTLIRETENGLERPVTADLEAAYTYKGMQTRCNYEPETGSRGVVGIINTHTPSIKKSGKKKIDDDDEKHYEQQSFRSVTDLKAAGITTKPSKSNCLKDIHFTSHCYFSAKLELPTLIVDDSTASKLLNLIAYEMCPDNTRTQYEVTSYVDFLDSLIDYASDVKELRSARILRNFLGCDEEVAQLFNEIGRETVPNTEIYKDVISKIEKHYKNKCVTWVAQVLNEHFSTPWTVVAFLAAIVALLLTGIQTWFTIFPSS